MKMKFDLAVEAVMKDIVGMPLGTDKQTKGEEKVNQTANVSIPSAPEDKEVKSHVTPMKTAAAPKVSVDAKGKDIVNKPTGTDQQTKGEQKLSQKTK